MKRAFLVTLALGIACSLGYAQQQSQPKNNQKQSDQKAQSSSSEDNRPASERFPFPGDQPNQQTNSTDDNRPASEKFPFPGDAPTAPPRSDPRGSNDSSSKDRNVDISPPPDDYKHDGSDLIGPDPAPGVTEMKPWNPHQADKDVEVGMFYFRQKNYPAAESRFREALYWQDNHSEAMYRLATVLEKQGKLPEAKFFYQQYLKILPKGELAKDSKKALARIGGEDSKKAENKTSIARP